MRDLTGLNTMSHPYYPVSPEEQREIIKNLSVQHRNDYVSAVKELQAKLGKDHSHTDKIGHVTMSAREFTDTIRHHYKEHLVLEHVNKVTKQNYTSLDHV